MTCIFSRNIIGIGPQVHTYTTSYKLIANYNYYNVTHLRPLKTDDSNLIFVLQEYTLFWPVGVHYYGGGGNYENLIFTMMYQGG